MYIIAHNIRSMHNVGAILRNAAAFGVEKVYLTGITATPPRKEIAKVALGAEQLVDWEQGDVLHVIGQLQEDGVRVLGLDNAPGAVDIRTLAPSGSPMPGGGTKRVRGDVAFLEISQQFRREPTPAEKHLWGRLRRKQLAGFKFRRQHGIGPFIVDFYCDAARLIVEIDGDVHDQPEVIKHDKWRQTYLEELGYSVIRFSNNEVLTDPERVIKRIQKRLPSRHGGVGGGKRLALVLGNEVDGIDQQTIDVLDGLVEIPMAKKRSLNVSVASGIAMFVLK